MARIESYPAAPSPISGADKLIGTDSANNNETKNFSVQEVSNFVKPYKVYTALLTQTGSNPPTAVVIENTIGSISFTYLGSGTYYANSSGLFTNNKTIIFNGSGIDQGDIDNPGPVYSLYRNNNTINIWTQFGDDVLYNTSIEIRVYP
jgi:hypothetical protein